MLPFRPNPGKSLNIQTDWGVFSRYPVKTHVVMSGDSLTEMAQRYLAPYTQSDDFVFVSEKIVAISQGRAFRLEDIKPSRLANFLCRFVTKTPYGIGLGSPWTMELALREIGRPKILLAAFAAAVTKPLGIKGVFYRICGPAARAIDGPCDFTIPPYNNYAKLAPAEPDKVAKEMSAVTGCRVVIIDANDLGVDVLGRSHEEIDKEFCKQVFRDNPLDQADQQTPLCIVRYDKDGVIDEPAPLPAAEANPAPAAPEAPEAGHHA